MNTKPTATIKPDKAWITGIILILLSIIFFYIPTNSKTIDFIDGFFLFNYCLAIIYFIVLSAGGRLRRGSRSLAHIFLLLSLALLSCYALNRTIPVFAGPTTWWSVLLVIACLNYSTLLFFPRLPSWLQSIICFIAGISFIAFLYLAIYLMPTYIIGIFGLLILGFSLHLFVPALFVAYTLAFIIRAGRIHRHVRYFFFAGILFTLAFITQYAIRWHLQVKAIDYRLSAANTTGKNLPRWITVAENCSASSLEEAILKTDLVYTSASSLGFDWIPHRSFDEKQQHDPLIVLATLFSGATHLDEQDRINVLKALFTARHKAERRLWSGDDLVTTDISTDVQLWPQLHLSYTEEKISVVNTVASGHGWTPPEEALYTFHLPEGAVVSALSLWIDGKEQKGVLTSRQKADSAYTTIVGRESHDPSVVHWQEGNTVTVRVFPVTTETRRFKLGITAPLEKQGQKLAYHSIWFDGPTATEARSSVRILPMQRLIKPDWPAAFQSDSTSHLRYPPSLLSVAAATQAPIRQDGAYTSNWTLQCEDPGIEAAIFRFDGKQYTTAIPASTTGPGAFRQVYLDLNSAWTPEEFESLLTSLTNFPVYASLTGDDLVNITPYNKNEIFASCSKRLFSLFPLQRITDYEHALLISKSTPSSPNLSDLNGSPFSVQLQEWLDKGGHLTLYNIGDELSPYLRALRETGAFHYEKGDCYTLQSHLHHNAFPMENLAVNEVMIDPAGLLIRRTDDPADTAATTPHSVDPAQTAPDHLLRLFAYRRILQQQKGRLPGAENTTSGEDSLQVQIAQKAGIVSPVSSYVVLEKQADYDRFGIHDDKSGLQNASLHGKGAVPEPGEWAILISVLALFAGIRFHRLRQQHRRSTTSQ